MSRGTIWLIILSVVVFWDAQYVDGCNCFPTHPQKLYCDAEYVYTGTVLSEKLLNGLTRRYRFGVLHVSKGKKYKKIRLDTATTGAACGIKLTKNQFYVIAGRFNKKGKKPISRIGLCSFIATPDTLTFQQWMYLYSTGNQSYKNNCGCKNIKTDSSIQNGCELPQGMSNWSKCYFKTALCQRAGKSCVWKNIGTGSECP